LKRKRLPSWEQSFQQALRTDERCPGDGEYTRHLFRILMNKTSTLIIDDEVGILETIGDILDIKGYEVETAENGARGVEIAKTRHFDFILTDIVMPEMNGVEAYHQIKQISPDTEVIMMTGYGSDHPLVITAIHSGIKRLLHKPFEVSSLLKALNAQDVRVACVY
jgi:YesN/AraC family two-component response regulator